MQLDFEDDEENGYFGEENENFSKFKFKTRNNTIISVINKNNFSRYNVGNSVINN